MEKIKQSLKHLGFNNSEIKVYFCLLENGSSSILEIAQKTNIPRATIYTIIKSLVKKGLVNMSVVGKKNRFITASPEKLLEIAEDKKYNINKTIDEINQNWEQLQSIFSIKSGKPKIRYYEGVEGIKSIYEDSLKSEEIYVFCLTQNGPRLMGDYLKKYFIRVIRKMIKTKEIVSDSKEDKEYQKEFSTSRNEIICLSQQYMSNTDYLLYQNKVVFISYKNNYQIGVMIQDEELARFERMRFEILWKTIKKGLIK